MNERMWFIRLAALWAVAFLLPVLPFTARIPYGPYLLVPLLIAARGLSRPGPLAVSMGLPLFLYEVIFHLPLGILLAPFVIMSVIHLFLAQVIRFEQRIPEGATVLSVLFGLGIFLWWHVGMVVLSSVWDAWVIRDEASWRAVWTLWRGQNLYEVIALCAVFLAFMSPWRSTSPRTGVFPI